MSTQILSIPMALPQVAVQQTEIPTVGDLSAALKLAAEHADDVDRKSRFPQEAIDALREAGALGCYVPTRFGGRGATFEQLCEATFDLAKRCTATGMVFAMHQIQVGSIVHHLSDGSAWYENYLRRLVREQRLIASATSEMGVGGEMRRSIAAVEPLEDGLFRFEKKATTISYGNHSDDIMTTMRRHPEAEGNDQVIVLHHRSDTEMQQTTEWDTLGMRGTCSPGFAIKAICESGQILPTDFAQVAAETVVPFSHLLWSHVWMGAAAAAYERAHGFVKGLAKQNPGVTPPAATPLSKLSVQMNEFRSMVRSALQEYVAAMEQDRAKLSTIGYAVRVNELKIFSSEKAAEICQAALRICGILGYKNNGPYSIGRQLRDSLSAQLMVANDRIHSTNATLLLVHREVSR
jgi:acyl-CoA dehydrogenase